MVIPDPESRLLSFPSGSQTRIPDPRVKTLLDTGPGAKGQKPPDPGSVILFYVLLFQRKKCNVKKRAKI